MSVKAYRYLNFGDPSSSNGLFSSKMAKEISKAQNKAPPKQWAQFIKGLTTKGVKGSEIDESKIVQFLESSTEKSLTKDELVSWIGTNTPTIKELDLSKPNYAGYHHKGHDSYRETLYILNSQRDNITDRLEEVRFELEELDFDLALLASNPVRAIELSNEQMELLKRQKTSKGHPVSHFSDVKDPDTGAIVSNMIAHCRTTTRKDLYFIEEVQSDWAQRGRKQEWRGVPEGPFVTNTELWAGLVLRRQMQRACEDQNMNHFAWIRGHLRNGWTRAEGSDHDGLDDFYMKVMPKLADKALQGTGEKVRMVDVELSNQVFQVPGFDITEKVREKMRQDQPLYSRDVVHVNEDGNALTPARQRELDRDLKGIREMLGSVASVRLAARVLDIATGKEVAGRHIGHLVEISLKSRNPTQVAAHEAWHYAYEHLIGLADRDAIDRAFANGSRLNNSVRMALVADGANPDAIKQCDNAQEAAAHAFSLWTAGKMTLTYEESVDNQNFDGEDGFNAVGRIFKSVEIAFIGLSNWIRRVVGETQGSKDVRTTANVFALLNSGRMSQSEDTNTMDSMEMASPSLPDETLGGMDEHQFNDIANRQSIRQRAG